MTTILMIALAAAVVCVASQSWTIHRLMRERDMYVNRTRLYRQRWEDSQRALKAVRNTAETKAAREGVSAIMRESLGGV